MNGWTETDEWVLVANLFLRANIRRWHFHLRKFPSIPTAETEIEQKIISPVLVNVLSVSVRLLNLYFPLSSPACHRISKGRAQQPRKTIASS